MQRLILLVLLGLATAGLLLMNGGVPSLAEEAPAKAAEAAESKKADDSKKEPGDKAKRKVDKKIISDPGHKQMKLKAPATYEALFKTTKGDFTIVVTREWAPIGADRFYSLVKNGYYDGQKFFRVAKGFVVQWGIHGDPEVNLGWYRRDNKKAANLKDDPVKKSNTRGTITYANGGPDTRSTQVFINFGDNSRLDDPKKMRGSVFAPFGKVKGDGMKIVDKLYNGYNERPTSAQGYIAQYGNAFLDRYFPKLDSIISATIVEKKQDKSKQEKPAKDADAG